MTFAHIATVYHNEAELLATANQNSNVATNLTHFPGTLATSIVKGFPNQYCTAGL
ncbi:MAG: hypothetical protein J6S85_00205 [Methanobrevibacter sp.]|nr:hypothetical protein [Methanobrevibacter sp.]